eukprot:364003-Chlamydomonas_euryale.AAC.23
MAVLLSRRHAPRASQHAAAVREGLQPVAAPCSAAACRRDGRRSDANACYRPASFVCCAAGLQWSAHPALWGRRAWRLIPASQPSITKPSVPTISFPAAATQHASQPATVTSPEHAPRASLPAAASPCPGV